MLMGLVAGPLAWLAQLQANYALVGTTCADGQDAVPRSILLAIHALALAGVVGAGLSAWHAWPAGRLVGEPRGVEGARLLSLVAVALCASFVLVLIASALPTLFLRPC
jgi:hypothetical protein